MIDITKNNKQLQTVYTNSALRPLATYNRGKKSVCMCQQHSFCLVPTLPIGIVNNYIVVYSLQ